MGRMRGVGEGGLGQGRVLGRGRINGVDMLTGRMNGVDVLVGDRHDVFTVTVVVISPQPRLQAVWQGR